MPVPLYLRVQVCPDSFTRTIFKLVTIPLVWTIVSVLFCTIQQKLTSGLLFKEPNQVVVAHAVTKLITTPKSSNSPKTSDTPREFISIVSNKLKKVNANIGDLENLNENKEFERFEKFEEFENKIGLKNLNENQAFKEFERFKNLKNKQINKKVGPVRKRSKTM